MVKTGFQAGHGFLEDHGDLFAPDLSHPFPIQLAEVLAAESNLSFHNPSGRVRDQPHDGEGAHGFAATALPHKSYRLPLLDIKRDPVNGSDDPFRREELSLKVPYFQ